MLPPSRVPFPPRLPLPFGLRTFILTPSLLAFDTLGRPPDTPSSVLSTSSLHPTCLAQGFRFRLGLRPQAVVCTLFVFQYMGRALGAFPSLRSRIPADQLPELYPHSSSTLLCSLSSCSAHLHLPLVYTPSSTVSSSSPHHCTPSTSCSLSSCFLGAHCLLFTSPPLHVPLYSSLHFFYLRSTPRTIFTDPSY